MLKDWKIYVSRFSKEKINKNEIIIIKDKKIRYVDKTLVRKKRSRDCTY